MSAPVVPVPSGQELYEKAVSAGLPCRTLLQVAEALHTDDPIAAIEWLLSIEDDATARDGFQAALDTLRAREAQNTACVRCDGDTDAAPAAVPAPGQPGRLQCATTNGETGAEACGVTDTQVAVWRELYAAAHAGGHGDYGLAMEAAEPLLDTIADGLAAYLVREDGAWLAMARYCLDKAAASAAVYERGNVVALVQRPD